jgi:hypothetical protein
MVRPVLAVGEQYARVEQHKEAHICDMYHRHLCWHCCCGFITLTVVEACSSLPVVPFIINTTIVALEPAEAVLAAAGFAVWPGLLLTGDSSHPLHRAAQYGRQSHAQQTDVSSASAIKCHLTARESHFIVGCWLFCWYPLCAKKDKLPTRSKTQMCTYHTVSKLAAYHLAPGSVFLQQPAAGTHAIIYSASLTTH